MKIVQVYDLGPESGPPIDGVGLAILNLSACLVAFGHQVTWICGRGPLQSPVDEIQGVRIRRIEIGKVMQRTWNPVTLTWGRQLWFPACVTANLRELDDLRGADIVHGHIYSGGAAALLLGRLFGSRVINTIHGSYYDQWEAWMPHRQARLARAAEKQAALFLARTVDAQVHTGGYFADTLTRWGADKSRLHTIHNGVAASMVKMATDPCLREPSEFITIRRLVKKNGLHILLEAFAEVLRSVDARLVIGGSGPEAQTLLRQAERLGIDNRVAFLGPVQHEQVPQLVSRAQVGVLPSLAEASSLFLLECMALCRPVVCTRAGGLGEVVNSSLAWLVDPGDPSQLAEAMTDSIRQWDRSVSMARAAQQLVKERYTWEAVARRTLEVYNL